MPRLNGHLIGLGIFVATLVATPVGAASVPADFCSGNPCIVTGTKNADAGSVVNFGGRSLVLASGAKIIVGAGPAPRVLTLIADEILMEAGSEIRGFDEDLAHVTLEATTGTVTMLSAGSNRSEIDVRAKDFEAGSINIQAATDAIIGGRLTASASGEDSSGGAIEISAGGTVSVTEEATTKGSGSFAGGGTFSIEATGDVVIAAKVLAEGADFGGGDVSVTSTAGSITVSDLISNNGGNPDGEAGEYTFSAATSFHLVAGGEIRGKGGAGADDDCGDGAYTTITSGTDTIIDGLLDTQGGFQCFGGDIDITAGNTFMQNGSGKIDTATGGGFGSGGPVTISAVHSAVTRKIDASSAGFGGEIVINAGLFIDVLDKLNAKATGSEGIGARIVLSSCGVNVLAPNGELDTRGPFVFPGFGTNEIKVSGTAILTGKMFAATENRIRYLGTAPTFAGSASPAITFIPDPTLLPCENACGDDSLESPEVCDDGNISSCDGCASDCTRPDDVCGDGIPECGEQCDDGNMISGDGCENDCTPTGQEEEGVLIESRGSKVGCQAQWLLQIDDPDTNKKGQPSFKQVCVDGDFSCDADGVVNNSCSFLMSPCVNVPDDDLPECDPSRRVEKITLKKPLPSSNNTQDAANASAIVTSLTTLGTTVEADGVTIQTGQPVSGTTVCGSPLEVQVPFDGKSGKKTFKLRTQNEVGQTMKKGQVQLKCERNDAICGNSVLEPGETCDDGNGISCDGCSSCRTEICGNGTLECQEQCDEGLLNGTEGSNCSATCTVLAPELRIPGGGSKKTDCMFQWSMEIGAGNLLTDKNGNARNKQTCTDGNALCDFDPTPGNCRVRLWGCVAAENANISCPAVPVDSLELRRPKSRARNQFELQARVTLVDTLGTLPLPATTGEICTNRMEFDIPKGEKLRIGTKAYGTRKDSDSLKISCD